MSCNRKKIKKNQIEERIVKWKEEKLREKEESAKSDKGKERKARSHGRK